MSGGDGTASPSPGRVVVRAGVQRGRCASGGFAAKGSGDLPVLRIGERYIGLSPSLSNNALSRSASGLPVVSNLSP